MTRNPDRYVLSDKRRIYFIPAFAGMLLCVLLISTPVYAQSTSGTSGFFSGAYLMQLCASDTKGKEMVKGGHTACQSYISGMIDYHMLMKSLGTAPTIDFCVPNTVPMRRLQNIVYVYLLRNAQHSQFIAAPAVALALYEYYPCRYPAKSPRKRR